MCRKKIETVDISTGNAWERRYRCQRDGGRHGNGIPTVIMGNNEFLLFFESYKEAALHFTSVSVC